MEHCRRVRNQIRRFKTVLVFLSVQLLLTTATQTGNTPFLWCFLSPFSPRSSMAIPATSYPARLERTEYKGWSAYRLTNGIVSLYVAPDIGGRAIQMQLGD